MRTRFDFRRGATLPHELPRHEHPTAGPIYRSSRPKSKPIRLPPPRPIVFRLYSMLPSRVACFDCESSEVLVLFSHLKFLCCRPNRPKQVASHLGSRPRPTPARHVQSTDVLDFGSWHRTRKSQSRFLLLRVAHRRDLPLHTKVRHQTRRGYRDRGGKGRTDRTIPSRGDPALSPSMASANHQRE